MTRPIQQTHIPQPLNHQPLVVATLLSTKRERFLHDEEFGNITYRRVSGSRHVRIKLNNKGALTATLPMFAPMSSLVGLIESSREELRRITLVAGSGAYYDGQLVGHSHRLQFVSNQNNVMKGHISQQTIRITHPAHTAHDDHALQTVTKEYVAKALRIESKAYLPRRLARLAEQGQFTYQKVRFAHQSGRWGSCSSRGTISLNIALMNLPFELIDYVLVHELAHTKHMNHSPAFWSMVEQYCPNYTTLRKELKTHNPNL